jgi:hypothetical protein
MKSFRFDLQRILEFRHARLAEEERKLKLLQMELKALDRQIEDLLRARLQSAIALAAAADLRGEDLRALAGFKARLRRGELALQQRRSLHIHKLRRQQEAYLVSRRDHHLLEELRKRRFAEWQQATNRELDQLASDLYLARWDR